MPYTIKSSYENKLRKFTLNDIPQTFKEFNDSICALHEISFPVTFSYKDEEGDTIYFDNLSELSQILKPNTTLKIFIEIRTPPPHTQLFSNDTIYPNLDEIEAVPSYAESTQDINSVGTPSEANDHTAPTYAWGQKGKEIEISNPKVSEPEKINIIHENNVRETSDISLGEKNKVFTIIYGNKSTKNKVTISKKHFYDIWELLLKVYQLILPILAVFWKELKPIAKKIYEEAKESQDKNKINNGKGDVRVDVGSSSGSYISIKKGKS
ncbi:hypothetical protein HDU92_002173 [Lobulomyces angularis]|nr:hypothetical protein HDU92_002173 [Lobulomyces angularis]